MQNYLITLIYLTKNVDESHYEMSDEAAFSCQPFVCGRHPNSLLYCWSKWLIESCLTLKSICATGSLCPRPFSYACLTVPQFVSFVPHSRFECAQGKPWSVEGFFFFSEKERD